MLCIILCYQIELTTEIQYLLENGTCKTEHKKKYGNYERKNLIGKYTVYVIDQILIQVVAAVVHLLSRVFLFVIP